MHVYIFVALLGSACASNLAELEEEVLAEEQAMMEDNALAENTQEINTQALDDEENLDDQQLQGEDIQIQNEDTQLQNTEMQDEDTQLQNTEMQDEDTQLQNTEMQDEDTQLQNTEMQDEDTQLQGQEDMQFQNIGQQFTDNSQLLNEGEPAQEMMANAESALTAVSEVEDSMAEGIAAADAEGVPPPNEFSGAPPLPGTLKNLAAGEAPAEYRIEPGDTLYDVCDQLLGEPSYWPKLWSMNDTIKNPHFVYPDFVLQFFPGDAHRPPAMRVVGIEELEPEGLDNEELVAEETAKLFKDEDESDLELLNPEDIVVPPEVRELFNDYEPLVSKGIMQVQLPALILPDMLDVSGTIVSGANGAHSVQDDQDGYVQGADLETGRVYTVLRYQGVVREGIKGYGHRYDFIASLRVKNFIGAAETARAQIFGAAALTMAGDVVVEYRARSRRIMPASGMDGGDGQGRIINLTYNGQEMGARGDFAFVHADIGSSFSKNQVFRIFRNANAIQRLGHDRRDASHPIGTLQIVDVTDEGAISYIVSNNEEIMLGDVIGSG